MFHHFAARECARRSRSARCAQSAAARLFQRQSCRCFLHTRRSPLHAMPIFILPLLAAFARYAAQLRDDARDA
jgi:hypothetical protein